MINKFYRNISLRNSLLESLKSQENIFEAIELMTNSIKKGNKILIFGNGGSATQSAHFAAEMVNKFYLKRKGLPAIALTTNCGNITSIANDYDFKYIFSKQIEAIGETDDVAMGITTSGQSKNILEALKTSKTNHLKTICLCGKNVEPLEKVNTDIIIPINSDDTPAVQEMHLFILHTMAEILETRFFGDKNK
ncbi:MAG: SIS domain-containing protein [Candidatus Aminicenantes bacterium]|nr:SIS domain-containing protein [Candidatus Aminicenantes bacterium]